MNTIWLIGTGEMAKEYAKVLKALGRNFLVVGRGEKKVQNFKQHTGIDVIAGGLENYLNTKPALPTHAIVAVGIENLSSVTQSLLHFGVKKILLEKPGVGHPSEIHDLVKSSWANNAKVVLAYNRRFYASVIKAREIIQQDGGVTSFSFEFTEWSHVIGALEKHPAEHNNWFLGNSTHVIDTAFYLCGQPKQISAFIAGKDKLNWHPISSIYAGAGETANGALFSYQANWSAPGRWVIEIMTKQYRLVFKPMEKLQIQKIGSVAVEPVDGVDYALDEQFKPGVFLQTKAFLNDEDRNFCSLEEQAEHIKVYAKMSGYNDHEGESNEKKNLKVENA